MEVVEGNRHWAVTMPPARAPVFQTVVLIDGLLGTMGGVAGQRNGSTVHVVITTGSHTEVIPVRVIEDYGDGTVLASPLVASLAAARALGKVKPKRYSLAPGE